MKRFEHVIENMKSNATMPYTTVAHMPADLYDFGGAGLTEHGKEVLNKIIIEMLPPEVIWCNNDELVTDIDTPDELIDSLDINEIINKAYDKMINLDDPNLCEEE